MLTITYILALILGCQYAFKRMVTDPDRDKIWGPSVSQAQFNKMEREVEALKAELEQYKSYRRSFADDPSREESLA